MKDELFYAKSVCMNDGSLIEYRSTFPETITYSYPDGTRVIQTADKCVTIMSEKRRRELLKQQQGYRNRVIELLGQGSVRNRSEIDRLSEKIDELDIVLRSGIIEERSNDGSHYTKDEHGRFTGSTPYAGGSGSSSGGGGGEAVSEKYSSKTVEKTGESSIIESGSDVMYRKKNPDRIEPMPKKQFHRIEKAFKKQGGIFQYNEETDDYLNSKNAEAITYDAKTILFRTNPGRASVFEELIHTFQYRIGKNDGSYVSRLECEIEAQKKLIKHSKAYKLTEKEIEQTKAALSAYESELASYNNKRR